VAAGLAALGTGTSACGSDQAAYKNVPRPPSPITVTASIDKHRVRVSPTRFGAGPVEIIVSNQSGAVRQVTFETDEIGGPAGGIRTSTGPIGATDTATIQVDPRKGTYRLGVRERAILPARIVVGARRPSAQNELLQP
jgi:hypothetical protein